MTNKQIETLSLGMWNRRDAVTIITNIEGETETGKTVCCRVGVSKGNQRKHTPIPWDEMLFGETHQLTFLHEGNNVYGAMMFQTDEVHIAEENAFPINSIATRIRRIAQDETVDVIYGNAIIIPTSLFKHYEPVADAYVHVLEHINGNSDDEEGNENDF